MPPDTVTTPGVLRLDRAPTAVEVHHGPGCRSALLPRLPYQPGHAIVTAPDEHWAAVTEHAFPSPSAF
ncbi:hypothetical protein ACFV0O_09990 [Kitasatospora sp. NPDC059577]|uniref:hypothetical protein n=1 Tax=Kitasatospora sp. NPDC059577 TaxID=3346873 RepID=UPI0036B04432